MSEFLTNINEVNELANMFGKLRDAREALDKIEPLITELDHIGFESVMCTLIDIYCSKHHMNPKAMAKEMYEQVVNVNNTLGPL